MKILFLTNLLPYPLDNGGKIKTYTTLRALFEAGHIIDLFCFKETKKNMNKEETEILKFCNTVNQIYLPLTTMNYKKYMVNLAVKSIFSKLPFSIYKYQSIEMIQELKEKIQETYDVVYFDHLPMCVYLDFVRKSWRDAKIILDEHNCETTITRRKANESSNILKRIFLQIEAFKLKKFESNSIQNADKTIVLSKADYEALKLLTKKEFNHSIISIGVPDHGKKKNRTVTDSINILFVGTLTWEPNNTGLIWFLKEIIPILEKRAVKFHLYIVGKNPSQEVIRLSESYKGQITITGYVESVDEYYDRCDCTIVPLFIGSGQRVKLIEAFSKGMPAISTTIGAEGLEYENGKSILIADDKETFANKILLMNNIEFRDSMGRNCRRIYEKFYSPKVISNLIVQSID